MLESRGLYTFIDEVTKQEYQLLKFDEEDYNRALTENPTWKLVSYYGVLREVK